MANLETLFIQIDGSAAKATSSIDNLVGSLSKLSTKVTSTTADLKEFVNALKGISSAAGSKINWKNMIAPNNQRQNMKATAAAMKSMANANSKYAASMQQAVSQAQQQNGTGVGSGGAAAAASASGSQYVNQMQQTTAATQAATAGQQNYANATQLAAQANNQLAQAANQANNAVKNSTKATSAAASAAKSHVSALGHVGNAFKRLAGAITSPFKQVFRMAKSMLIRTAIRALMKSAKEGLENYYHYSKTAGNGFSDTMDQMAGKAAQAKNQLGAALASAIMTLTPALNALADAAIWCLNAITALFAALGGRSTYSRATKQTAEFASATKSAGGAVKDLLADFDELNVITSQGGGGGSGSSTPDYGSMFEEAEVPEWLMDLAPWIKWAAILGGIAAVAAKIWDWFSKIKNLFNKFKTPTMPTIPSQPDWTTFEQQLQRIQKALQGISSEITGIDGKIITLTTNMGLFETAVYSAAVSVGILAAAMLLVKSPSIKIKVDRDDFDKWKKDLDDITEDLKNNPRIFKIVVNVDMSQYVSASMTIAMWCGITPKKNIVVTMDLTDFNTKSTIVESWVNRLHTKYVDVKVDPVSWPIFWSNMNSLDTWSNKPYVKKVGFQIEPITYGVFKGAASGIDKWANTVLTKTINVVINVTTKTTKKSITAAITEGLGNGISSALSGAMSDLYKEMFSGAESGSSSSDLNINPMKHTYFDPTVDSIAGILDDIADFGDNPAGSTWNILTKLAGLFMADGAYDIPRGDIFVANEQGAELVGSINGKTSVANQEQIIAGISRGVEEANNEQNMLLREQNSLLRDILRKDSSVKIGASAALGRVARQSLDMYSSVVGG